MSHQFDYKISEFGESAPPKKFQNDSFLVKLGKLISIMFSCSRLEHSKLETGLELIETVIKNIVHFNRTITSPNRLVGDNLFDHSLNPVPLFNRK